MHTKKLDVLSTASLSAEFKEDNKENSAVFFYKNTKDKTLNWSFTKGEVIEILRSRNVSVKEKSDTSTLGLFQIGLRSNWYYSHKLYEVPEELENDIYMLLVYSVSGASLVVELELFNDSNKVLTKVKSDAPNKFYDLFPASIEAKGFAFITLTNEVNNLDDIEVTVAYSNSDGSIQIIVDKSYNRYDSTVKAIATKNLIDEVKITNNTDIHLAAKVIMAQSLVMVNMQNLYNFFNALDGVISRDQIDTPSGNLFDVINYNKARQIFNTRIQLTPFAIVRCKSTEEVQFVYTKAIENNLAVRVRSGGHDHEGECSGTDTILIDTTLMNKVHVDDKTGIATIEPGNRFVKLTTELANNPGKPVMIPHGTCATVGIAGFTLGGGWGPWTRAKGMCCESLVGATIVLGNGERLELSDSGTERERDLLWALRGGGGFSYGIVTELKIQTFDLPTELIKFEVEWNPYLPNKSKTKLEINPVVPTLTVLQQWENAINDTTFPNAVENKKLIGTNLKISAIPLDPNVPFDETKVYHNCIMYGYWEGTEASLRAFIQACYGNKKNYTFRISGFGGAGAEMLYGANMMSNWDRESLYNVKLALKARPPMGLKHGEPLPPDYDAPAPHKITSRLVEKQGLEASGGVSGYREFLSSLTSPLIEEGNRELGLFSYVTLGAINGSFYSDEKNRAKLNSAFPFKDRQYTIQYQTWWNENLVSKESGENNPVYLRTNRALDWMDVCRDNSIPNTSGAFISFKDSSIPTASYFGESYEPLKKIKMKWSEDPYNHFRTRKTII